MDCPEKKVEKITKKQQLYKAYSCRTEAENSADLTEIIMEVRNMKYDDAKWIKNLYPREVRLFRERVDPIYR